MTFLAFVGMSRSLTVEEPDLQTCEIPVRFCTMAPALHVVLVLAFGCLDQKRNAMQLICLASRLCRVASEEWHQSERIREMENK